jgi:predicted nucleic acid-binding protein
VKAVLDTNVLVSALWSADGNPAAIIETVFAVYMPAKRAKV